MNPPRSLRYDTERQMNMLSRGSGMTAGARQTEGLGRSSIGRPTQPTSATTTGEDSNTDRSSVYRPPVARTNPTGSVGSVQSQQPGVATRRPDAIGAGQGAWSITGGGEVPGQPRSGPDTTRRDTAITLNPAAARALQARDMSGPGAGTMADPFRAQGPDFARAAQIAQSRAGGPAVGMSVSGMQGQETNYTGAGSVAGGYGGGGGGGAINRGGSASGLAGVAVSAQGQEGEKREENEEEEGGRRRARNEAHRRSLDEFRRQRNEDFYEWAAKTGLDPDRLFDVLENGDYYLNMVDGKPYIKMDMAAFWRNRRDRLQSMYNLSDEEFESVLQGVDYSQSELWNLNRIVKNIRRLRPEADVFPVARTVQEFSALEKDRGMPDLPEQNPERGRDLQDRAFLDVFYMSPTGGSVSPGRGGGDLVDQTLAQEAPQINAQAVQNRITAAQREASLRDAQMMRAQLSSGARTGVSAEAAMGQGMSAMQQAGVNAANIRTQLESEAQQQNFQAQMQHYQNVIGALNTVAQNSQDSAMQRRALQASVDMQGRAAEIQRQHMEYQWELQQRIGAGDIARGVLGIAGNAVGTLAGGALGTVL